MHHPDELQNIVRVAKDLENQGQLRESKHKFLDAADYALQLSKTDDNVKKLTYQNLAKELVKYAKDLQMEILLEQDQLPLPPGQVRKAPQKIERPKVEIKPTKSKVELFQLLIIREGGIPVYSHAFSEISNSTKLKLNEILFSGAITAINQIMLEVLEKSIQTIKFEDGVLIIQPAGNLFIILYASDEDQFLQNQIKSYCSSLQEQYSGDIEASVMSGKILNGDPSLTSHMKTYFVT